MVFEEAEIPSGLGQIKFKRSEPQTSSVISQLKHATVNAYLRNFRYNAANASGDTTKADQIQNLSNASILTPLETPRVDNTKQS